MQVVTMSSAHNVLCIFVQQTRLLQLIKDLRAQLHVLFAATALCHMSSFQRQDPYWWRMYQGSRIYHYHFAHVQVRYWSQRMNQPTWKSHFALQQPEFPTLHRFAPWAARGFLPSNSVQPCAWEPMLAPPWFLTGVWGATHCDVLVLVLEEPHLLKREESHLGFVHWINLSPLEMDADFIMALLNSTFPSFIPQILVAPCLKSSRISTVCKVPNHCW